MIQYSLAGQQLINGSFETNGGGCEPELTNAEFNAYTSNIKAYGELNTCGLLQNNCGSGSAKQGQYFASLKVSKGITDALGIESSEFLLPGINYTLEFWVKNASNPNNTVRLFAGVSVDAQENGELLYSVPELRDEWTRQIVNFSPPIRAKYITVLLESGSEGTVYIDGFKFVCPTYDLGQDYTFCPEERNFDIRLTGPDFLDSIRWSNNSSEKWINIREPGQYTFTAWAGECILYDTLNVTVLDYCGCELSLPNIFSPNGDGHNDEFKVNYACRFVDFFLQIFDRWGNIVYASDDPKAAWDGRFKGNLLGAGIYPYVISYSIGNERFESKYGTVMITF